MSYYSSKQRSSIAIFQRPLFLLPLLFRAIYNPQLRTSKMVNIVSITTVAPLTFEISLKDTSFHISMNSLGFYLSRMVAEFSLKPVYSTMFGENFQISGIHIPRKCIVSKHFCLCPSPLKAKLLIPPGSVFSKFCFL